MQLKYILLSSSLAALLLAHPLPDTRSLPAEHEHLDRSVHLNSLSNELEQRMLDEGKEILRNRNPSLERRTDPPAHRPLPPVPQAKQAARPLPPVPPVKPAARPLPPVPAQKAHEPHQNAEAGPSNFPGSLVAAEKERKAQNRKATLTSAPAGFKKTE